MNFAIKIAAFTAVLCSMTQAAPAPIYSVKPATTPPSYSTLSPYQKCVNEHGSGKWPYPGPGDCHNVGWCQCLPEGNVGCVC